MTSWKIIGTASVCVVSLLFARGERDARARVALPGWDCQPIVVRILDECWLPKRLDQPPGFTCDLTRRLVNRNWIIRWTGLWDAECFPFLGLYVCDWE